jgi:predicted PurR-regulated permease PerM
MATATKRGWLQPSQIGLKTVLTVCFGVLLVTALVAFVLRTTVALTLFSAALLISVALDHLVARLEKRGWKRHYAVGAVMFGCVLVIAGVALLLIPPVVSQTHSLVEEWPELVRKLRHSQPYLWLESRFQITRQVKAAQANAGGLISGAVAPVLVAISTAASVVIAGITIFFLTALMLLFGRDLVRQLFAEVRPTRRERYRRIASNIYDAIGGYLGGILLICTINATCTTLFLALTGEPYFLPLGVLSGLSSMIPYAGPAFSGVLISGVAWVSGGVWKAVATAAYFIIYGQVEGNILAPIIFRKTAHVNPLITLVSILFFAELAGIFGAIVAVPIAAAAQIVVRELFQLRRERIGHAPIPPSSVLVTREPPDVNEEAPRH